MFMIKCPKCLLIPKVRPNSGLKKKFGNKKVFWGSKYGQIKISMKISFEKASFAVWADFAWFVWGTDFQKKLKFGVSSS